MWYLIKRVACEQGLRSLINQRKCYIVTCKIGSSNILHGISAGRSAAWLHHNVRRTKAHLMLEKWQEPLLDKLVKIKSWWQCCSAAPRSSAATVINPVDALREQTLLSLSQGCERPNGVIMSFGLGVLAVWSQNIVWAEFSFLPFIVRLW